MGMGKNAVIVIDYDETITTAPDEIGYIMAAIRAYGGKVIILTGNPSPRSDLQKNLDDLGIQYDDLVQYEDEGTDGQVRAQYLKQLNADLAIDNRADRAITYGQVCPHLYLIAEPPSMKKKDKKDAKQQAKQDVKKQLRSLNLIGGPHAGETYQTYGITDLIELHDGSIYKVDGDTALHVR